MPIVAHISADYSHRPTAGHAGYGAFIREIAADGAWLESLKILTIVNGAAPVAQRAGPITHTSVPISDFSRAPVVCEPSVLITDLGELARRLEIWEAAVVPTAPIQRSSSTADVQQSFGWFQRWRKSQARRAAAKQLRRACRSEGLAWMATDEHLVDQRKAL